MEMSRVCPITGKRTRRGYFVANSNKKVRRSFYPNLQYKRIFLPSLGKWIRVRITAEALRWIAKNGVEQYERILLKTQKKG